MRADIVPGNVFPDYELPDHTGTQRKLSELQGDDPLILTLARGHYCPKEHQQHLELAAAYPKIAVAYTQVVTISTDDHHTLQEFRASVGAVWTFLSDPERKVQKDLDIQEYTDPEHNPMIPHTLVLKPGLVIHSIYNGYWFWGRPSVADLWHDLRAVTKEIRPDWDLSTPGLREAWDAGDLSRFHGWDKKDGAAGMAGRVMSEERRSGTRDEEIRAALDQHWAASDANDFDTEHRIYREDAVLDYPQSGERTRGRRNIQNQRASQPNKKRFSVRRIIGSGDLWVTEFVLTYDGKPSYTVSVMEFEGEKVVRETQYFADPFAAPASRAQWVERMDQ